MLCEGRHSRQEAAWYLSGGRGRHGPRQQRGGSVHADHVFKVIDAHAGGARTRMVFSGIPRLAGASVMDKMQYFAAHHDWIRRSLVLEPRGGGLTSGVVLVPPSHPDADIGAFFMEAHGYLPMCGSDTICTVTAMIETGQIAMTGSRTAVRLDTPAGLI